MATLEEALHYSENRKRWREQYDDDFWCANCQKAYKKPCKDHVKKDDV